MANFYHHKIILEFRLCTKKHAKRIEVVYHGGPDLEKIYAVSQCFANGREMGEGLSKTQVFARFVK